MNKYLVKIAEKHELEPGVTYNTDRHLISISPDKRREIDNHHKNVNGLVGGLPYGILSGLIGIGYGGRLANRNAIKHPNMSMPVKLLNKSLPGVVGATAAAGVGGALYGLHRAIAGTPEELQKARESAMIKLEKKYEKTIHKIHGWDDE
jgi:hypothetical protein